MKKLILATVTAAAVAASFGAAQAGPHNAVPGEFVDDVRTGLKNGN